MEHINFTQSVSLMDPSGTAALVSVYLNSRHEIYKELFGEERVHKYEIFDEMVRGYLKNEGVRRENDLIRAICVLWGAYLAEILEADSDPEDDSVVFDDSSLSDNGY